jgi:hypothetical protein
MEYVTSVRQIYLKLNSNVSLTEAANEERISIQVLSTRGHDIHSMTSGKLNPLKLNFQGQNSDEPTR